MHKRSDAPCTATCLLSAAIAALDPHDLLTVLLQNKLARTAREYATAARHDDQEEPHHA